MIIGIGLLAACGSEPVEAQGGRGEQIKELREQIAEERREMMQEMRGGQGEGAGRRADF